MRDVRQENNSWAGIRSYEDRFANWCIDSGLCEDYSQDKELQGIFAHVMKDRHPNSLNLFATKVQTLRTRTYGLKPLARNQIDNLLVCVAHNPSCEFVNVLLKKVLFSMTNREINRELVRHYGTSSTEQLSSESVEFDSIWWQIHDASYYFHRSLDLDVKLPIRFEYNGGEEPNAWTDGKSVYLQKVSSMFHKRELNALVFVYLLAHELIHLKIGSFDIDWSSPRLGQFQQNMEKPISSYEDLSISLSRVFSYRFVQFLQNVFEDIRVESYSSKVFPQFNRIAAAVYRRIAARAKHPELINEVGQLTDAIILEIPRVARGLSDLDGNNYLLTNKFTEVFHAIRTVSERFGALCHSGQATVYDTIDCTSAVLRILEEHAEQSDLASFSNPLLVDLFDAAIEGKRQAVRKRGLWDEASMNLNALRQKRPSNGGERDNDVGGNIMMDEELALLVTPSDRIYDEATESGLQSKVVRIVDWLPDVGESDPLVATPQVPMDLQINDNRHSALRQSRSASFPSSRIDPRQLINAVYSSHKGRSRDIYWSANPVSKVTVHCVVDLTVSMEFARGKESQRPINVARKIAGGIERFSTYDAITRAHLYGSVAGGRQKVYLAPVDSVEDLQVRCMGGFYMGSIIRDMEAFQIPQLDNSDNHVLMLITDAGPWHLETLDFNVLEAIWNEQSLCKSCSVRAGGSCHLEKLRDFTTETLVHGMWKPNDIALLDLHHAVQQANLLSKVRVIVIDSQKNIDAVTPAFDRLLPGQLVPLPLENCSNDLVISEVVEQFSSE